MVEVLYEYISRFISVTSSEVDQIYGFAEMKNYDKKIIVVGEGEVEHYFNFILKGLVRKFFIKGSEEIITQIAKENDVINSSVSFLTGNPSAYIVETIEPTCFLSFSKSNIQQLYKIDRKYQKLGRLLMTEVLIQKEKWELDRLRLSTQDRFISFLGENEELFRRVPQKYLASYLNIKPETFSRLKHLLKTGLQ